MYYLSKSNIALAGLFSLYLMFCQDVFCQFTDVTFLQGIENINEDTFDGNGVSFYDFNYDGWDDLTLANGSDEPLFYLNNEGTFELVSLNLTINPLDQIIMVLWADYDNDGDADLLTTQLGGYLQLWQNDGNFNFIDVSGNAGLKSGVWEWWGASFCDYDHDGFLDLFVAKFYNQINDFDLSKSDHLYHNNGDGTFTDVTVSAGVSQFPNPTFQPVWFDYDHDGWEDLYLIIDRAQWNNILYRNNGNGTFTDVSISSNSDVSINAMTGTIGDYNNDLDLDVYITNGLGNVLLENNNDGTFSDIANSAGLSVFEISWGSLWLDYNNNTWQDLFVGTTNSVYGPLQNMFFVNNEDNTFQLANDSLGMLGDDSPSFVCAMGDINNDGYYDFVTNNNDPYPSILWQNDGGDNNFLSVSLEGVIANRDGIGSWITCYSGGNSYMRFTHCGEDLAGQASNKEIFGLAQMTQVDSLSVEWNSGTIDWHFDLEVNQHLRLIEGQEICYFDDCTCPGDFSGNNVIDLSDMLIFLSSMGCTEQCPMDITGDDQSNIADLLFLLIIFASNCP